MKKHYLVLYEKSWMKNELIPNLRTEPYCTYVFKQRDFKKAKYVETKEGSKIDDIWMRQYVIDDSVLKTFDGVAVLFDGNRLNGRNGVHIKKTYDGKKFSIIQVEGRKGWYRTWRHSVEKNWYFAFTRSRSQGAYKALVYTFEHEIGHSLCWLYGITDTLHLFVKGRGWEAWWGMMMWIIPQVRKK